MGWSVGFDSTWNRDIGYGVPAICDRPRCGAKIDRGLSYVCGSEPYGGEHGCGLYFCSADLCYRQPRGADRGIWVCPRCLRYKPPYKHPTPDTAEWLNWKLTDESWAEWRRENPAEVERIRTLAEAMPGAEASSA